MGRYDDIETRHTNYLLAIVRMLSYVAQLLEFVNKKLEEVCDLPSLIGRWRTERSCRDPASAVVFGRQGEPQSVRAAVRIEFGYQEFGAPGILACTSRGEDCFTPATATRTDLLYASETQSHTSCGSGCTVNVPALPGRVLYYRIHRKNAAGVESVGPVQMSAVP